MFRKYWRWMLISPLLLVPLIVAIVIAKPQVAIGSASLPGTSLNDPGSNDVPAQQIGTGTYLWSYAAKFVCGYQPNPPSGVGELVVKPGNYATEINIHNYNYRTNLLRKKFLLLVQGNTVFREPQQVQPTNIVTMTLGADFATLDDCNGIWSTLFPGTPPPTYPMPLMTGYLVILSPLDLDVATVYTSGAPGTASTAPSNTDINVVYVPGKRVFVPTGTLP